MDSLVSSKLERILRHFDLLGLGYMVPGSCLGFRPVLETNEFRNLVNRTIHFKTSWEDCNLQVMQNLFILFLLRMTGSEHGIRKFSQTVD